MPIQLRKKSSRLSGTLNGDASESVDDLQDGIVMSGKATGATKGAVYPN